MTDTTTESLTPAQVLDRMADELESRGHVKFQLIDRDGRMCVRGAYNYVLTGDATAWSDGHPLELPVADALELVLGDRLDGHRVDSVYDSASVRRWRPIVSWNNSDEATGDDVIQACRAAARRARDNN